MSTEELSAGQTNFPSGLLWLFVPRTSSSSHVLVNQEKKSAQEGELGKVLVPTARQAEDRPHFSTMDLVYLQQAESGILYLLPSYSTVAQPALLALNRGFALFC